MHDIFIVFLGSVPDYQIEAPTRAGGCSGYAAVGVSGNGVLSGRSRVRMARSELTDRELAVGETVEFKTERWVVLERVEELASR